MKVWGREEGCLTGFVRVCECRDRCGSSVDSACKSERFPWLPRGGTAGRPGSERLMRLPSRMCPLGKGNVAWLFSGRR